jgi:hypothetical protein
MWSDQNKVLVFSKTSLELWQVSGKKKTSLFKSELKDNFTDLAKKISQEQGLKDLRILFSDDLCYLLNINVPIDREKDREFIQEKVQQQVPDILESKDWDYKVLGKVKDSKDPAELELLVFAPLKKYIELLRQTHWLVTAMEPESIAKKRHEDPVIGLSKKKDLTGKDERVLNLQLEGDSKSQVQRTNAGPKFNKLLLLFIILLGLALGATGAWWWPINL